MKTRLTYYLLYLALFCLYSCAKEEEFPKALEYPYLQMQHANADSTGIKVSATILHPGETAATEYGFAYKVSSADQQSEVRVSAPMVKNAFSAVLSGRLVKKSTYEIRAYAIVDAKTIYSAPLVATSTISSPPVITDFFPKEGPDYTEVTISGFNFTTDKYNIEVYIGPLRAYPISATTEKLVIRVPESQQFGSFPIQVKYNGQAGISEEPFKIWGPEITKVSKLVAVPGDTVTIFGKRFSGGRWGPYVYIGGTSFKVLSSSDTKILVEVPFPKPDQFEKPLSISVRAGEKTAFFGSSFNIHSNFTQTTSQAQSFQSWYLPAFEADGKGYFFDRDRVLSYSTATGTWREESKFPGPPRTYPIWNRVGDKAYLIGGTEGIYYYGDVWEYDFRAATWQKKTSPTFSVKQAASFVLNGKIYFTGGTNSQSAYTLFRYDPKTDQFTTHSRVPGYTSYGKAFIRSGKAYVLINNNVIEYNPILDSWETHSQFSQSSTYAFTVGYSEAYLLTQSQNPTLYHYQASTNTWEKAAFYPGCMSDPYNNNDGMAFAGFATDNTLYVGMFKVNSMLSCFNSFYKYTP